MKKTVLILSLLLVLLTVIPLCATVELSTNLKVRTTTLGGRRRLVERQTYVDADGNPTIPSDKGYATIKYSYGSWNVVVKEEFLDEQGNAINCLDGYMEYNDETREWTAKK